MASGKKQNRNFVFWKLGIESMFGEIEVFWGIEELTMTSNLLSVGWVENCTDSEYFPTVSVKCKN